MKVVFIRNRWYTCRGIIVLIHFIVAVIKPAVASVEMSKIFGPAKLTRVQTHSRDRCSGQRSGFASSRLRCLDPGRGDF